MFVRTIMQIGIKSRVKKQYVGLGLAAGFVGVLMVSGLVYAASVDSATVFLMHADGADASTVFSDVAGHTITTHANAQVDTAQSKFGGAAAYFDGTGDYLSAADSNDFEMGSDDFTIDLWFRTQTVAAGSDGIVSKGNTVGYSPFLIYRTGTSLYFYATSADGSWDICSATAMGTIAADTWYHLAVVRNGNTFTTYLNGTAQSTCVSSAALWNNTEALLIGVQTPTPANEIQGWVDEVRISKGVARWTANFTPPTMQYTTGGIVLTGNVNFLGNLTVVGALSKGAGTFEIDHPLDPTNKLLFHSFVESPDVKNIYDGMAKLDENGEATVMLPDYFEALNKDFRYLWTPIGESMPGLYIKEEIQGNQFTIAGGKPRGKVSWQVTSIRHDAYIEANPIRNEVWKDSTTEVSRGECLFEPLCE